jgi:hypothetical protein
LVLGLFVVRPADYGPLLLTEVVLDLEVASHEYFVGLFVFDLQVVECVVLAILVCA